MEIIISKLLEDRIEELIAKDKRKGYGTIGGWTSNYMREDIARLAARTIAYYVAKECYQIAKTLRVGPSSKTGRRADQDDIAEVINERFLLRTTEGNAGTASALAENE